MATEQFDPVAAGQAEAKKNAKLDKAATTEAEMKPQDVGTAERDIPEGAPVTDEPQENEGVSKKATSKDADEKKDLPDDKKVQDTTKDSATPSPSKADEQDPSKTAGKK